MNSYASLFKSLMIGLLAALFLLSGMGSVRASNIAQVPLFISLESVNPNIMFLLDDSGSMQFEGPEEFMGSDMAFVFPRATSVYGDSDYTNRAPTVDNNEPFNAVMRSSAFNPFYYNPAITYTPWVKADGSLYPNANKTCAYHNPENTGAGCRNLTTTNTHNISWRKCSSASSCSTSSVSKTFWPAAYFTYNGGGQWTWANYTKTEIRSTTSSYSGDGRTSRTDCSGGTCTYEQEIQNFANWYSYYRSRILSARAGIGRAFVNQSENLRVGFGTINSAPRSIDGVSTGAVLQGVRSFNTTNRGTFLNLLYGCDIPAQGTPLRLALDYAGKYFSRKDNKGPWADVPGTTSGSTYSCRRSYTILMTDGYWNGSAATSPASNNNDGIDGPTIVGPDSQSFTYKAVSPFTDSYSSTLADVAMHYWKNDLNTDLDNRVPPSTVNPAFWQHMVTFGVGFGVQGTAKFTPAEAFAAINSGATITWPQPGADKLENVDDLLHAAVNSRGGYFSAKDPDSFAAQLAGMLEEIVSREKSSASALATTSTKLDTNTMSYQAKFDSNDWSGQLVGYSLDPILGTIGDEKWNTDSSGKIPAPQPYTTATMTTTSGDQYRKIYTLAGNAKKEFLWANLDSTQKTALKTLDGVVSSDTVGLQRLNWIRGYQNDEKPSGALRKRTKLLGDIVNSDPFYVGKIIPNPNLIEQTGYADFIKANTNRTEMLYVGANDGMLHAFNAQTGVEKFAYIPKTVFPNLSRLPEPAYNHRYFVDGSPIVSEAYLGGEWKSVLIGTTGAGGRSIFALDITNPDSFDANKILWEFADPDLGFTIGRPTIGQLKDGTWVVVFGNGYESDNGKAFIFVVDLASGALIAKTSTLVGDTTNPNGLAEPAVLPDTDGKIVAAYAGDLRGNLWKYDLNKRTFAKLFTAENASGIAQPITSAPAIAKHPNSDGYLVFFGTGKYFEAGDHSADIPVQSLYGIWDQAKLEGGVWQGGTEVTGRSDLQKQEVIGESTAAGNKWRMVSKNPINWVTQRGWYLELPAAGERITDSPTLNAGRVLFVTRIPRVEEDPCIPSVGTSWFMAVDMETGGRPDKNVFDVDRDGTSSEFDYVTVNGEEGVVSGFETTVAGMSQATLMRSAKGIQVLLSGTSELSTTASSVSESTGTVAKNLLALVKAAVTATATSAADAQAAQAAQAAAQAAQAAADAAPDDPALAQAAEDAAKKKAAAEAAVVTANETERQAVIDAAQAIINAAQEIIDAGGAGNISKAEAEAIKNEAVAIKNQASAIPSGELVPPSLSKKLPPLAARLQGQGNVGTPLIIQASRESWQQLQ